MFNSTAVCRTVSRLLAGTDGNPAYGGDKHGGRSYPSSDYRGAFYRAVCGTALKNRLINAVGALVMSLVLGLTTAYIISRKRFRFGMKKPLTYWVLLVNIPLVIWFMVSFFEELPEEVEESGNLQAFLYVCMEVDFAVQ